MSLQKQSNWKWHILIIVIVLLILAISGIGIMGFQARQSLLEGNPPNGQLIDVDGVRLHMHCLGAGSPTVIMEAGLNDFSLTWSQVQTDIASFSRVCVYDRAGLGWSESSQLARTSENMVNELHTLLQNAAIEPPYILVGHSFGGINVRLYTQFYPADVVGIVLVDASHEDMFNRIPYFAEARQQAIAQFRSLSVMSQIGLLALSPEEIPAPDFPHEALRQYRAILGSTAYFETVIAESSVFEMNLSYVQALEFALLEIPLIVLSRGQPEPLQGMSDTDIEQFEVLWSQMQSELLVLSTDSTQIIAEISGHYIQLSEPELVIDTIRELVSP